MKSIIILFILSVLSVFNLDAQDYINKIVNLRTENENNEFASSAYHEEMNAKELGFEYHCIPINGTEDYTPEKLDEFLSLLNKNEKILIHCRTGGRVTNFFMA